jgi:hypothetical protein
VKLIRILLAWLVAAILLVLVVVLLAIAPPMQTWAAQRALAGGSGVRGSLDSISAGFGGVDVENLEIEAGGASLKLPSLQASLPITTALLRRRVEVRSLVARGWTLDLSRGGPPADAGAAAAAPALAGVVRGLLGRWELPFDASLDGVELEGDVVLPGRSAGPPVRVHVVVTGGGASAGREGAFTVEATADAPGYAAGPVAAHGRLTIAMDSPRTVGRIGIRADLPDQAGPGQPGAALSVDASAARGAGGETYSVDLIRGPRHLATLVCRYPEATRRLAGTWKVDLRDADLAALVRNRPLPSILAAGDGLFDFDEAFARLHALGSVKAVLSRLGVLAAPLERVGTVTLDAGFDLARSGSSIRVDRLSVSLAGARPAVIARSLQPFEVDERSGEVRVADPQGDWLGASVRALPLEWLSGLLEQGAVEGGDASGEFVVRASGGGFALRAKAPLTAAAVSVQRAGRTLVRGVDLSASISADRTPRGWQVQWAPLALGAEGRRLATLDGKAGRLAGEDQPISVTGTWSADLEAMASRQCAPALGWMGGRSASGDFAATLASTTKVEAKVLVTGRDPAKSVAASVRADFSPGSAVTFEVPFKVAFGPSVSELRAEGTWAGARDGDWADATLTGQSVALEHLPLLASSLAALGGAPVSPAEGTGTAAPAPAARDRSPFWGDWTGHLAVAFDRLRTPEGEFTNVGAVFDVDRGAIHMKGGRGGLGRHLLTNVAGSVSFDPAAEVPYALKAAAAAGQIDAAPLFPAAQSGQDPLVEGHFSVQGTLAGNGANLDDLLSRAQIEFRLTSTAGIVRLLRANVAESLPEPPSSPVSDTMDTVGSVVGTVFGVKKGSLSSGKSTLSKNTDAVLNFTYQVAEIGYDRVDITAIRASDGTVRLADIEMTAPDEHLKGSGLIGHVKGEPLFRQPLSLELRLGTRGKLSELLTDAGLLSPDKDGLGYALLGQPIRFGGTLEHIDASQWNEMLVKAATRKPDAAKKAAEAPAGKPR